MIRSVLFDLDDTLMDHHTAASRAVWHWAQSLGLPGTRDELAQRWARLSNRHYSAYQRREQTMHEQQQNRARDFLPHLDLREPARAQGAFDEYAAHYRAASTAFPDARPALERARTSGLRVGVLTNGHQEVQQGKLVRGGLDDLVDTLVATSTLPWSKPDARAFHAACERVGTDPGSTLMVGNDLRLDVLGARAAGLPAVLVDRHDAHAHDDLRGAVRLTSLADLFAA